MPGKRAFGVTVSYSTTSGGTYTPIVGLTKVAPWAQKSASMTTTSHDSANGYEEKVPTILDNGAMSCDYNFNDAEVTHRYIEDNNGVPLFWKVVFPGTTPTNYAFAGFISSNTPSAPYDNKMTASFTVEINGIVTRT